jgi:hypothetical protein
MPTEENTEVLYEMQTEAGRTALARRAADLAARKLDLAIEGRVEQLRESDPVICVLTALQRVALALPSGLLTRVGYRRFRVRTTWCGDRRKLK